MLTAILDVSASVVGERVEEVECSRPWSQWLCRLMEEICYRRVLLWNTKAQLLVRSLQLVGLEAGLGTYSLAGRNPVNDGTETEIHKNIVVQATAPAAWNSHSKRQLSRGAFLR